VAAAAAVIMVAAALSCCEVPERVSESASWPSSSASTRGCFYFSGRIEPRDFAGGKLLRVAMCHQVAPASWETTNSCHRGWTTQGASAEWSQA